ncbi:MAG: pseudouridylate synthase [Bacteroidales bacterium]|nr:pseudouridylate synthase [Bacteroidales bacterium]
MEKVCIQDLLPQHPPFVMVDALTLFENEAAETTFEVKKDNMLVSNDHLRTCGLIENIAQTSAARIGYYYKYVLRQPVKIGFIGAIRGMKVMRNPRVGERLTTRIEIIAEAFGMVAFAASVRDAEGKVIAKAEMKTTV